MRLKWEAEGKHKNAPLVLQTKAGLLEVHVRIVRTKNLVRNDQPQRVSDDLIDPVLVDLCPCGLGPTRCCRKASPAPLMMAPRLVVCHGTAAVKGDNSAKSVLLFSGGERPDLEKRENSMVQHRALLVGLALSCSLCNARRMQMGPSPCTLTRRGHDPIGHDKSPVGTARNPAHHYWVRRRDEQSSSAYIADYFWH